MYPTLAAGPMDEETRATINHRFKQWTTLPCKRTPRILIIGMAGQGKSSVGNLLVGSDVFKVSEEAVSETTNISEDTVFTYGTEYIVIDTPGIEDPLPSSTTPTQYASTDTTPSSPGKDPGYIQDIRSKILSDIDVVILVMSESGSRGRDRGIGKLYDSKVLGDVPKERLMVVVTHAINYSQDGVSRLLDNWTKDTHLHKFLHEIGYRVVLVELRKHEVASTGVSYARDMVMAMVNKVIYDNATLQGRIVSWFQEMSWGFTGLLGHISERFTDLSGYISEKCSRNNQPTAQLSENGTE